MATSSLILFILMMLIKRYMLIAGLCSYSCSVRRNDSFIVFLLPVTQKYNRQRSCTWLHKQPQAWR